MMTMCDAVRSGLKAGLCLLPVREDGSKAPDVLSWKQFQAARPTPAEVRAWDFDRRAGAVSRCRDCWDFDDADTFEAFVAAAAACGLGDLVRRVRDGYEDRTPSGGRRWIVEYPSSIEWRDCTLARRPGRDGEPKVKTLIELPTFAILAPSYGTTHPSGRPYVRVSGDAQAIAAYSEDEREALIELARSFDRMPRRAAHPASPPKASTTHSLRPGDDFNARTTWPALLEQAGWTRVYDRGDVTFWCRPGKAHGVSATTNFARSDLFYVFTSSTEFDPEQTYTKFGAYTTLHHRGDFSKATLALLKLGYGVEAGSAPAICVVPQYPHTLADVEAIYARWIRDPDPVPTRAVLASYVANRHLEGDPVWLMLVGGSGVGKTERLIPLAVMPDVVLESSITGPAALLSGTAKKERAKDATGGLLRKIPDGGGVLLLKDFTSIIDMHRDARAEVLAALREVYDGRWDRSVGVDGGKTLTWAGHLGLIAGCTTAIDAAHAVVSVMGTRFVLVRLRGDQDIAGSAFDHVGHEAPMREELRAAVRGLLEHLPGAPHDKATVRAPMIALASCVALARSPVDRDQRSEIRLVLDPEASTRIVKMLTQLWRAAGMLGLDPVQAWGLVRRIGLDSIPKLRRAVLDHLASCIGTASTTDVARAVEHPQQTTRRALEDLAAHRVVIRSPGGSGKADRWELAPQTRRWLDATVPVLSDLPESTQTQSFTSLDRQQTMTTDKAGKVGQDMPENAETGVLYPDCDDSLGSTGPSEPAFDPKGAFGAPDR